ncbi:MAG TPA: penicillin-binding protein [Chloroflexi bacterium]|nr:penicillin-binding protein [Chloroflexota bacterium]
MPQYEQSPGLDARQSKIEGGAAEKDSARQPQYVQPLHAIPSLEDTQPMPAFSPHKDEDEDEIETGEIPGTLGDPTIAMPRVPTGATPTADLPRTVPPPQRPGYVPSSVASSEVKEVKSQARKPRDWGQIVLKGLFITALSVVLIFFLGVGGAIVGYMAIARQLPPPEALTSRQTTFVSSKILDREGRLLFEVMDPHGGRRTRVSLSEVSPYVFQATIATEDRNFYAHPGFDPIAIIRAIYYNLSEGGIVSGGSTIPQQVARNLLLDPEERIQQTAWRKIKEIVLAAELMRTYPDRNVILEIYLNENNYGNLAYGIQAASETYFGVDADELTLGQAAFLAGLPQSPATYDPFAGGLSLALRRQETVLSLMVDDGYINHTEKALAIAEIREYEFKAPRLDLGFAPHFVVYARQQIEAQYGPEALYQNEEGKSLRIYTTLDRRLQRLAEQAVREGLETLADRHATNGALVAIDPATGHVLAMVGSVNFHDDEIDGQVNVALRCRQPGSSIKPFTYVAAFERGWTPATTLWDVRTEFPDGANPPYVPVNFDGDYHGPMSVRKALANSYNVPAVEALQFVGVDGLLEISERLGVKSLVHPEEYCPDYPYDHPPYYGLSLTLGGGEAKLLEMTGAFAVLANRGIRTPVNPILRIEDSQGNVLVDNAQPQGEQVVSPEHAYLITHILSDVQARCVAFRCPSVLALSRPAAAKTGTTNDFRDALTIGYTPDLATGVWVGNADNTPMINVAGAGGAGPIWHNFMEAAHADWPVRDFERPPGVREYEVCADSGAQPSKYCPRRKRELFAKDQPPPEEEQDWYQIVRIDQTTGLLANEFCPNQVREQVMVVIQSERGREWAQAHPEYFEGLPLAPLEYCNEGANFSQVFITSPAPGSAVQGVVPVMGTVQLPAFEQYEVRYGVGDNPDRWDGWISGPHLAQVTEGLLTEWNVAGLPSGPYTLLVRAFSREQEPVEARVTVFVAAPTSTVTPIQPPTSTPTPVSSPSATATSLPTATAFPTPVPPTSVPPTAAPSASPTTMPTEAPTLTPTFTPTVSPTVTVTGTASTG